MEVLKNAISSIFTKSGDVNLDHFIIQISQLNKQTRLKDLVCEGHGSWLGQIYIEGKK
jgi:hypothetical protein